MSTLKRLLQALTTEMERTAESAKADAVHDLRVAARRLSAALQPGHHKLRKRIRRIRKKAALVRDRDVALQLVTANGIPKTDPARHYLKGQRDLAAQQLQSFLKRQLTRHFELPADEEPPLETPSMKPLFEATDMHQRRIAAKRLRYALEVIAPAANLPQINLLRKIQTQLGEIRDADVAADLVFTIPTITPSARAVARKLRLRAGLLERKFLANWPEMALPLTRK